MCTARRPVAGDAMVGGCITDASCEQRIIAMHWLVLNLQTVELVHSLPS